MNSGNKLMRHIVKIVNTKDFLAQAENIKVSTISAERTALLKDSPL